MVLQDTEEAMAIGIRKILAHELAHDIRMKKESTNQGGHFLDF